MTRTLLISLRAALVTLVLTGLLYPFAMTGLGALLFPAQAGGSLVSPHETLQGSALLAQKETRPAYFQPRPSAVDYQANTSGGSNLGPTSAALRERITGEAARLLAENPSQTRVPVELVTASGSGLDPHLSPEAARWQAERVARARRVSLAQVEEILARHVEGPSWGVLGEPRVNVLALNVALDAALGAPSLP